MLSPLEMLRMFFEGSQAVEPGNIFRHTISGKYTRKGNQVVIYPNPENQPNQVTIIAQYPATWTVVRYQLVGGRITPVQEVITAAEGTPYTFVAGKTPIGLVTQIVVWETSKLGKSRKEIESDIQAIQSRFKLSYDDAKKLYEMGYTYDKLKNMRIEQVYRILGKEYIPPEWKLSLIHI